MIRFSRWLPRSFLSLAGLGASLWASPPFHSQNSINLVFDGDSIALGLGGAPGKGLAEQTAEWLGLSATPKVVARSGSPVAERLRLYTLNVAPLIGKGKRNVLVFHGGDNDIILGASALSTYAALTEYVRHARVQGWKIIVSTELQRFDFPEEWGRELSALNDLIRANSAGADFVADYGADPLMGGPEHRHDPIYYTPDGVHPTSAGYKILARLTAAAVARALDGGALSSCEAKQSSCPD